jgi:hypothetical protein
VWGSRPCRAAAVMPCGCQKGSGYSATCRISRPAATTAVMTCPRGSLPFGSSAGTVSVVLVAASKVAAVLSDAGFCLRPRSTAAPSGGLRRRKGDPPGAQRAHLRSGQESGETSDVLSPTKALSVSGDQVAGRAGVRSGQPLSMSSILTYSAAARVSMSLFTARSWRLPPHFHHGASGGSTGRYRCGCRSGGSLASTAGRRPSSATPRRWSRRHR